MSWEKYHPQPTAFQICVRPGFYSYAKTGYHRANLYTCGAELKQIHTRYRLQHRFPYPRRTARLVRRRPKRKSKTRSVQELSANVPKNVPITNGKGPEWGGKWRKGESAFCRSFQLIYVSINQVERRPELTLDLLIGVRIPASQSTDK